MKYLIINNSFHEIYKYNICISWLQQCITIETDQPGMYVYKCKKPVYEDMGMIRNYQIVKQNTICRNKNTKWGLEYTGSSEAVSADNDLIICRKT